MKTTAMILILMLAVPSGAAELLLPGQSPTTPGIFFDRAASLHLLAEVEQCRVELPLLQDLVVKDEALIQKLDERVIELGKQNTDLAEMNRKALEAAEAARKSGPWYERLLSAGKWIAVGALLGFAAGAGR